MAERRKEGIDAFLERRGAECQRGLHQEPPGGIGCGKGLDIAPTESSASPRIGEPATMIIRSADFDTSAASISACPPAGLPEFPFIGRSNVGKSSLLNMLAGRKALARVSSRPGHTQLINFFTINNEWRVVDLPGYGYVKLPAGTREKFAEVITGYLTGRPPIRRVFVLIDSRLEPQRIDLDFLGWLMECGVPYALVFTKSDKLKPAAVTRNVAAFEAALGELTDGKPPVFISSSETRAGRAELLKYIGSQL